jgi:hypothetical protein
MPAGHPQGAPLRRAGLKALGIVRASYPYRADRSPVVSTVSCAGRSAKVLLSRSNNPNREVQEHHVCNDT